MSKITMACYVTPRIQWSKIKPHSLYIKNDQEKDEGIGGGNCEEERWIKGFPDGPVSKESACSVGDPDLITGSRRFPGAGHGNTFQ